jgi:UDP-hydrolysing UDP-N-acetyl-D-glucosamine 2-epimerase
MRTIGAVTVARSDYGIYLPILRKILQAKDLQLSLVVTGSHFFKDLGETYRWIEADHIPIAHSIPMPLTADTPAANAAAVGAEIQGLADWFGRSKPDILLLVGDRYEMHAAAVAAIPFGIPIAHVHGGEITEGAIDDALRHSLTKLSHLHFVTTSEYGRRLEQMGEEPWRITVSGAPSLDNVSALSMTSKTELEKQIGLSLDPAPILVTFHPVTLELEQVTQQMSHLLQALEKSQRPLIFTAPNADAAYQGLLLQLETFVGRHANARLVRNLGTPHYFSLMKIAAAMVGNSSSGIIEASTFGLPVVNIGNRQKGRIRASNVIDCDYETDAIQDAIRQALSPEFRNTLTGLENPYGDGHAAERIVSKLMQVELGPRLITKRFKDAALLPEVPVS